MKNPSTALAVLATLVLVASCARTGTFKRVEFTAPSRPDPALRPYLENVERIGVMCVTNIEPIKELDTEKVLARLSEAMGRKMGNLPGVTVVSQDEITWQLREIEFDSTRVVSEETRRALIDTLSLDAFVLVELENLQARVTPMTPTPYGLAADTGLDLAVNLTVSLVNLHSGLVWQQSGQRRDWQQVRLQLFGGDQGERQLLIALSSPLEQFLLRLVPPPRIQVRQFELSGE